MFLDSVNIIITLLRGVALFLFGMQQMSGGLNKVGGKMESILYKRLATELCDFY